ncbi:endoribonuclease YbeY [Anaplasma platys]|uniref:Endoribonuclease YbeY n=1 Tax=Anaplasma platys TaxID=949 RepID=A0A858PX25_9RICK|nr:rRNA maturation RNase YbeY [Anaplasma platys]QJC27132.1 endoribonuclease YbeY [Anaplasma platys]
MEYNHGTVTKDMPIEIQTHSPRWFRLVKKPHATTRRVLQVALKEIDVIEQITNISVVLANDSLLRELNLQYRKKDKPTNVLSFNYDIGTSCCGEIFLSIDTIFREACEMKIETAAHFIHMLLHGFLHIRGYTHDGAKDTALMQSKEIYLLSQFGIQNPYACG